MSLSLQSSAFSVVEEDDDEDEDEEDVPPLSITEDESDDEEEGKDEGSPLFSPAQPVDKMAIVASSNIPVFFIIDAPDISDSRCLLGKDTQGVLIYLLKIK